MSEFENSHRLLVRLVRRAVRRGRRGDGSQLQADVANAILEEGDGNDCRWIDPEDCGCTDCCVGDARPARSGAEYELAQACGVAR